MKFPDDQHLQCDKTLSLPISPVSSPPAACAHGRKRRAVAKGFQNTLSKTSMLVNFLPTGTLLTFEMLLPSASGDGTCTHVSTMMILVLLALCAGTCFFFHFTDSFRGSDGKVYYGFVTPKGLTLFKSGLGVEVPKDDRFKMGFTDLVHALMSVMVFTAIAFSDHRVTNCLFPEHRKEMDEVMETFPLMVGVICNFAAVSFWCFPTHALVLDAGLLDFISDLWSLACQILYILYNKLGFVVVLAVLTLEIVGVMNMYVVCMY